MNSTILALIFHGATECKFHSMWSYVGGLNVFLLFWHSRTALLNIINERSGILLYFYCPVEREAVGKLNNIIPICYGFINHRIMFSSETLWRIPDWFLCWNQPLLGVWLVKGQWKKDGKKHFWGFRHSDFSLPFFAHHANRLKAWKRFILAWETPITRWISLPSNIYLNNKNAPQRGAWVSLDLSRVDLLSFRVEKLLERSELWGFRPQSAFVVTARARPRTFLKV